MISRKLMNVAKLSYFGAGTASVLANFGNFNCGKVGAALFIVGTVALVASRYKRIEERYQERMRSAACTGGDA